MATHYVLWWEEQLRDGREDGAKVVPSLEAATEMLDRLSKSPISCNMTVRLFKLGEEIPLQRREVEEYEPPKIRVKYQVKRG